MRGRVATPSVLLALLAALALSGCGGEPTGKELTIAIEAPAGGALKERGADMGRAAQLNLDAIKSTAAGYRLKLVIGPYADSIAAINALTDGVPQPEGQLSIRMAAPVRREVRSPGARERRTQPRIWLVPPQATAARVTADYAESGASGAAGAITDNPRLPGTPAGRYVTAALGRDVLPPAGGAFFEKFNKKFGRAPDRWAIYAYEAVGLIVDALHRLEDEGTEPTPAALAEAAFSIRDRFSPLGHYDILPSGQSTLYNFQIRGPGAPEGPGSLLESLR